MGVTEVRVKLLNSRSDKLQAYCSVTLNDEFVIRDIKIIKGVKGCFVAMPSRKITDRCQKCGAQNHLRAAYCNDCGGRLNPDRAPKDVRGRAKLHADIAHPITTDCRDLLQEKILEAFEEELKRGGAGRDDYDHYMEEDVMDEFTRYEEMVLGETEGVSEKAEPALEEYAPEREKAPSSSFGEGIL